MDEHQSQLTFSASMQCRAGVSSRISTWQNRSQNTAEKAARNPFTGQNTAEKAARNPFTDRRSSASAQQDVRHLSAQEYGTPEAGTKADERGRLAGQRISDEVWQLCVLISQLGQSMANGTWIITFKHLFDAYTKISNKVVGLLLRARRQKLVSFEGEMLFQGRDDDAMITLLKEPEDIDGQVQSIRQNISRKSVPF